MRLEFEHNSSTAVPYAEDEAVSQDVSSEVERMFREGVRAAQEGRRAEARNLLLRVTEANADNENAWLWLASISEYPEELMVFLTNVLRINPANERALEWNKATKSLLAKTLVQRGMDAAGDNRRDFARQCFEQALEHEAENEMAWLWLASIADTEEEKTVCFERVLSINPENEAARTALESMKSQKLQKLFAETLDAAFDGRHNAAKAMLENVLSIDAEMEDAWVLKAHLAASFEERAECFLKLRALNPENEMAKACLASWRMLADRLDAARPQVETPATETVFEEAKEVSFDEAAEISNPEFAASEEFALEEFAAPEAAAEFDETEVPEAENEAPLAAAEFAETDFAEQPAVHFNSSESFDYAESAVAEAPVEEELDAPDSPTQELSFEWVAEKTEATDFEATHAPEENEADEDRAYEEYQAEQVGFEMTDNEEPVAEFRASPLDLTSQTEAEEAEMNWAFTTPSRMAETEAYFSSLDETNDDIHKTQQAEYDAEEFSSLLNETVSSSEEMFETSNNATAVTQAEDRRNASPEVFVSYAPAAPENSFDEDSFDEDSFEKQFAPMRYEPENGFGAAMAEEEIWNEDFEAAESVSAAVVFEEAFTEPVAEAPAAASDATTMNVEESGEPQMAEETTASTAKNETVLCPFCDAFNEKQAFSCNTCQTVLTLSDLEMLLAQQGADAERLRPSVESLERENESYGLSVEQMTNLGVGHINLKNYRQGFLYLQEAVRMNPSNVLLDAQVNALAIRLSEMEEQQTVHDAMSKNRRILVVDDSPTVRKLISGKLEKCGHEVVCAVDGADALEKIRELKPDLVLLDITMPRMDGYQVCKQIRSDETTKDVPVVMISGKDGFFDKVRGRMAGTSGYITKPFGPETLMKTVETYLN